MADVLTRKSNRKIILEPLDGTGRRFVLYGMRTERQDFKVNSPTRRTVANTLLTQQRMVSRRQYSIQFTIFEPSVSVTGQPIKPTTSSLYDEAATTQVPTEQQLQMIHDLAKLHEEGILLRYSGITVNVDRAAILNFSSETVYTLGTGTITIEERPDQTLDIEDIAISAEAFEEALKQSLGVTDLDTESSGLDALRDGTITPERYREMLRNYIEQAYTQDQPFNIVLPQSDDATLDKWGLGTLPYIIEDSRPFHDDIVMFPNDGSENKPKLTVIPLTTIQEGALTEKRGTYNYVHYVAAIDRLFVHFTCYNNWNMNKLSCRIEVFDGLSPPVTDHRTPSRAQIRTTDDAPEPVPSVDALTGAQRTASPVYVTYMDIPSMQEVNIADKITVSAVVGGKFIPNPKRRFSDSPKFIRDQIGSAIIVADYR